MAITAKSLKKASAKAIGFVTSALDSLEKANEQAKLFIIQEKERKTNLEKELSDTSLNITEAEGIISDNETIKSNLKQMVGK